MNRSWALRSALIAVACFVLGFLAADRMTIAGADPVSLPQDGHGAGFSGTEGAAVMKSHLIVIRGKKIYRLDPSGAGGAQRPWGELVE